MSVYLVCYDITDDGLRRRVSDMLGAHGDRVQRSVFEIRVANPAELDRLHQRLSTLLTPEPDAELRFYHLCARCRAASTTLQGEAVGRFPSTIIV